MDLINYSSNIDRENDQLEEGIVGRQPDDLMINSDSSLILDHMKFIYWALAIIVIGVMIYVVVRSFKKTIKPLDQPNINHEVTYRHLHGKPKKRTINELFKTLFHQSDHPVRKMVYQFERKVVGSKYERKSFETIEEWLGRMKIDTDIAVYQKQRYGELDVSNKEVNALKRKLQEIEMWLERER